MLIDKQPSILSLQLHMKLSRNIYRTAAHQEKAMVARSASTTIQCCDEFINLYFISNSQFSPDTAALHTTISTLVSTIIANLEAGDD